LANVVFISEFKHQRKKNRDSGINVFTKVKRSRYRNQKINERRTILSVKALLKVTN